jgi:hypothetical protein
VPIAGAGRRAPGWRWWLFAAAGWTLDGILTATNYHLMGASSAGGARDWSALLPALASAWLWVPLSLGALWLAGRWPVDRGSWRRHLPIHVAAAAAVCLLRAGAVVLLNPWVGWYAALPPASDLLVTSVANNLLLFGMLVGVGHALHFAAQYRERDAQLARAELGALRMQLHPHFLFNALNTAAAYVRADPTTAERMIGRLGQLLRHALDTRASRRCRSPRSSGCSRVRRDTSRCGSRPPAVRLALAPPRRGSCPTSCSCLVRTHPSRHRSPAGGPGTVTIAAGGDAARLPHHVTTTAWASGRAAVVAGHGGARSDRPCGNTRDRLRHLFGPLPGGRHGPRRARWRGGPRSPRGAPTFASSRAGACDPPRSGFPDGPVRSPGDRRRPGCRSAP